MTKERIRIVMAEACGHKWYWRVNGNGDSGFIWALHLAFPPEEGIGTSWKGCAGETRLATPDEVQAAITLNSFTYLGPNYPDDLNACREFEERMPEVHKQDYLEQLSTIVYPDTQEIKGIGERLAEADWRNVHANAIQRCEAFIKTVCPEKWEEGR